MLHKIITGNILEKDIDLIAIVINWIMRQFLL